MPFDIEDLSPDEVEMIPAGGTSEMEWDARILIGIVIVGAIVVIA